MDKRIAIKMMSRILINLILMITIISCNHNNNKGKIVCKGNKLWMSCQTARDSKIDKNVHISYYLFGNNDSIRMYKAHSKLSGYHSLLFPCLEWRYLSDSTLILGRNEVYKYNFVNDSNFTIRLLGYNVIIDTFKLVRINIKVIDTIYVHKLKTL
jgi:hypothetical protein